MRRFAVAATLAAVFAVAPVAAEGATVLRVGWNETARAKEGPIMRFKVRTIVLRPSGRWTVNASFKNISTRTFPIRKKFQLRVYETRRVEPEVQPAVRDAVRPGDARLGRTGERVERPLHGLGVPAQRLPPRRLRTFRGQRRVRRLDALPLGDRPHAALAPAQLSPFTCAEAPDRAASAYTPARPHERSVMPSLNDDEIRTLGSRGQGGETADDDDQDDQDVDADDADADTTDPS